MSLDLNQTSCKNIMSVSLLDNNYASLGLHVYSHYKVMLKLSRCFVGGLQVALIF